MLTSTRSINTIIFPTISILRECEDDDEEAGIGPSGMSQNNLSVRDLKGILRSAQNAQKGDALSPDFPRLRLSLPETNLAEFCKELSQQ